MEGSNNEFDDVSHKTSSSIGRLLIISRYFIACSNYDISNKSSFVVDTPVRRQAAPGIKIKIIIIINHK